MLQVIRVFGMIVIAVVGLALFFAPTIFARLGRSSHFLAVLLINLFLGITAVGWIVAAALALTTAESFPYRSRPNAGAASQRG